MADQEEYEYWKTPDLIPTEVQNAARLIGNYFKEQGIVKWELMDICSRNHADQNRVYHGFFEFKKEHNTPPLPTLPELIEENEKILNEDLDNCKQCDENAWDGRICHSCGTIT